MYVEAMKLHSDNLAIVSSIQSTECVILVCLSVPKALRLELLQHAVALLVGRQLFKLSRPVFLAQKVLRKYLHTVDLQESHSKYIEGLPA